jgi:hypothetical protein
MTKEILKSVEITIKLRRAAKWQGRDFSGVEMTRARFLWSRNDKARFLLASKWQARFLLASKWQARKLRNLCLVIEYEEQSDCHCYARSNLIVIATLGEIWYVISLLFEILRNR